MSLLDTSIVITVRSSGAQQSSLHAAFAVTFAIVPNSFTSPFHVISPPVKSVTSRIPNCAPWVSIKRPFDVPCALVINGTVISKREMAFSISFRYTT